jgi:hypothetical protein
VPLWNITAVNLFPELSEIRNRQYRQARGTGLRKAQEQRGLAELYFERRDTEALPARLLN